MKHGRRVSSPPENFRSRQKREESTTALFFLAVSLKYQQNAEANSWVKRLLETSFENLLAQRKIDRVRLFSSAHVILRTVILSYSWPHASDREQFPRDRSVIHSSAQDLCSCFSSCYLLIVKQSQLLAIQRKPETALSRRNSRARFSSEGLDLTSIQLSVRSDFRCSQITLKIERLKS